MSENSWNHQIVNVWQPHPKGTSCGALHREVSSLIAFLWSAAEYLCAVKPFSDIVSREIFIDRPAVRAMGE